MIKYRVGFKDISNMLSPWFFREPVYQKYLFSLVKPLSDINDNGIPIQFFNQKNPSLYQFTIFITRFLQVNASRIVLEKYLNELFDPTNQGIVLENHPVTYVTYEFNDSEEHTVDYGYNDWDATVDYAATKEYVLAPDGNVYLSNTTPNISNQPPHANWDLISTGQEYLFNEEDTFEADYLIKIPVLVATGADYDSDRFKAIVNFFNAAGRTFNGVRKDLSAGDTGYLLFTNT